MINPPHPGESVQECIDEAGITAKECATRIGVTPNNMYRLLNGHIGVSPKVALGLEGLGWSNAEFWMRLQAQYDLAQLRLERAKHAEAVAETQAAAYVGDPSQEETSHGTSPRRS